MKLEFTKDEKQFINLILQDASNAAQRGGDRNTYREGKKLINLFTENALYVNLKWKEFSVIKTMVEDSIVILEGIVEKKEKNSEIAKVNLDFAKKFLPKLEDLSEKWG